MTVINRARAYMNHGRWIAGCPYCNSAEKLTRRQAMFDCSNCHQVVLVEWPPDVGMIMRVLAQRPIPETQNWIPGQSITDLKAENVKHGIRAK